MKASKSQKKRGLHFYYRIGLGALVTLLVAVLIVELLYPSVPDVIYQIVALVFGASFTAYLTVTTYDYISRTTQMREWKRQVQMGTWQKIYLPIYEDLTGSLRSVRDYRYPSSTLWYDPSFTANKTIMEIVNRPYLELLERYVETHDRYTSALQGFHQAANNLIQLYHESLFPEGSGPLTEILKSDLLYLAGRALDIPTRRREDYVAQFNTIRERYPDVKVDPTSALQILKSKTTALPETGRFLSVHSEMVRITETLLKATKEVVQKPYQI